MMFRLAHLSDIHLGPLPDVEYHQLVSKRAIGYVNWHRNRRRFLHDSVIDAIVDDMKAAAPDHVAITGDLVNLALDIEIEMARQWLGTIGAPDDVSVVPGNHDAYVPGAFDKICRAWGDYMRGDGAAPPRDRNAFPYLRVRGDVALIGVSSARAWRSRKKPVAMNGAVARGLGALLDDAGKRGLFRVVMIHHPPLRNAVAAHKRLFGIGRFQKTVAAHGAELILHGHSHLPSTGWFPGAGGRLVPVVGVAAAGQAPGSAKPAAQYNLFEISGKPGRWEVALSRRGLAGPAIPVSELSSLPLHTTGRPTPVRN